MVVVQELYIPIINLRNDSMKIKKALYNEALGEVLDAFEVNECELFESNKESCREGRMILVVALRPYLTCADMAELCPMWRSSICTVINKFDRKAISWSAEICLEKLKKRLEILEKELREQ